MRRFFVEKIIPTGGFLLITGKEARHIVSVLRMKKGETLILMDREEQSFEATIEAVHYKEVKVRITKTIPSLPPSPVKISLAQALIKSHPMEYLIKKVTELGIGSIYPFYSERTVIKLKPKQLKNKMDRWMEIMKSACKQCGRVTLPTLNTPLPFEELINTVPNKKTLKVLLWEDEDKVDLKRLLTSMSFAPHVFAIVGPEGGFTLNEINLAKDAGFHIISLGNRILRAETAAVSLLSIIQYEWGDLNLG
ncbi:MAG: 16S rRNA (uracil(1498)-N(3))-methyltransferase [Deltaproteobacteria bacterium]|nr:16S rRNA (uracil(1498)-N(3))-methyltransferase [Deltaproteobacteria bacterium]